MTKKFFEAPYLKVVTVKNDIIATSVGVYPGETNEPGSDRIQGRHGMWDDDFDGEDLY